MKLSLSFLVVFAILSSSLFFCCKNSSNDDETILKGGTTIIVDETLKPIIEDQIAVFESEYNAKIVLNSKSEKEASLALVEDTTRIIVLARELNEAELSYFKKEKIIPKVTKIGTDAIAFISNKMDNDTLISLKDVISFMKGNSRNKIKGLVFDNPNSSTVRYMNDLAGLKNSPDNGIYSFKTNEEVVKFVSENEGMIGVVGLNWLYQPTADIKKYLSSINVLSVQGIGEKGFFAPTQNNIAEGTYPLARDLFIINCQGFNGLGMGFASFVAGDIGQRIILKSGLLPIRVPGRKLLFK
ncbi:PstS family phosphate ABC transporter substrate-binding protein [Flavobacterium sp. 7A]|uniref:PstS family phosphate ABC transporter substrate-binding protein n=1 Tax=Flavobacterium sp. 7A TaxID=2940571 RepID=UPI00222609D4|nr:substrate-binding domain-containing protein [Flavobacterium sp. 7A]MCW2118592.1 phosphate transport system substrate-binding protein [Flavobacterium sp. 7A]